MTEETSAHDPERGAIAFVVALIVLAILVGVAVLLAARKADAPTSGAVSIENFQECVDAGYPVMESYPRQCKTPQGTLFVEDIGNALEKRDLIRVDSPQPNTHASSPLTITGQARGTWYFEASFPVHVYDANNKELASGPAQAQGDWMTEDFVPFKITLSFPKPTTPTGTIVLEKDNPSGLPEHDDQLTIPVRF